MSIRETHKTNITLDVQQLFEVSKAITDRIAKYIAASDATYPNRWEDIATLQSVQQFLTKNIEFVCDEYERELRGDDSASLGDIDELRRFMEGE